jgi:hypothetical protein
MKPFYYCEGDEKYADPINELVSVHQDIIYMDVDTEKSNRRLAVRAMRAVE